MEDNTVFDSVFKTMMNKAPKLIIPFINEAFGRDYPQDTPVVQFNNEHQEKRGLIISDSVFRVKDKIYHLECQSTPDSSMVVRMIEYDFAIALDDAIRAGAPYEMNFPESCVLFLRHTSRTPDELRMKVRMPDGGAFEYSTHVVKAQAYSSGEIFAKRLLLLLPYYLMRYKRELPKIADNHELAEQLVAECAGLRADLEAATLGQGEPLLYEQLLELIIRVNDYLLASQDDLRKKVHMTMGGEVIEFAYERVERLEREAAEAREQGIEQGIDGLSEALKARGVDEALIDEAVATLRENPGT